MCDKGPVDLGAYDQKDPECASCQSAAECLRVQEEIDKEGECSIAFR